MSDEGYDGSALLMSGGEALPVRVRLIGHVQPIDGHFRWQGRVAADERVVALVRAGRRDVTLRLDPSAAAVPARLGDPDPWGGVRITGVGRPPWPLD